MAPKDIGPLLVQRVNREMPRLEQAIKALTKEINFFAETTQFDGRTALERQNALTRAAIAVKGQVNSVAGMEKSVKRSDLGDLYGQFKGNYNAGVKRVDKAFVELDNAMQRLRRSVDLRINDPTRWSADPVSGAIDTLPEVLTMLEMLAFTIKGIFGRKDKNDDKDDE